SAAATRTVAAARVLFATPAPGAGVLPGEAGADGKVNGCDESSASSSEASPRVALLDAPRRITVVDDSAGASVTSPSDCPACASAFASVMSGSSVAGRAEAVGSVLAPAVPDFACVSVIDQSCS